MNYVVKVRDTNNNTSIMGEYSHDEDDLAKEHEAQLTIAYPLFHVWIEVL